ncbi:hypothetical protein CDD82_6300 [Ophiocordyceps australis]|uniref:Transcription factor Rba50 n=1 Tax=Ophiocordyceps australis TaxID=1399860 RepID=A0A2C5YVR4_9HYPO|nr:hypothetical protein CDD82_6300 [Ophiocordyceps australis]
MDSNTLIADIVERNPSPHASAQFSLPPTPASCSGFPQHKKRYKPPPLDKQPTSVTSAPNTLQGEVATSSTPTPHVQQLLDETEKSRIHLENKQKVASMSPQQVIEAQQSLLSSLDPAVVQRLLQRANIDEDTGMSPFDHDLSTRREITAMPRHKLASEIDTQDQATAKINSSSGAHPSKRIAVGYDEDQAPAQIPPDLFPIVDLPKSTHFPAAPSLPDVDFSDPNFLETLHGKYFANLPADPSKLAWMAPLPSKDSPADKESPYYPHSEIALSALRFDFRGRFLPPRLSRSIPSTIGLHHHGQAPEAAGYTIAELARLARSAVPAQRCLSFQTLGRILYRLGKGEWGLGEDDPIAVGIWDAVKQNRVLDSLLEAASTDGGHQGTRAYAIEALWLLEKGGWKNKFKGR